MAKTPKKAARSRGRAPTLDDVAKRAGVSRMTVSRVINNASNVSDKTRTKVSEAIGELGYSPNAAARSLAGGQPIHIAMLYAKSNAYVAEFLYAGLEQARQHNAQFVLEQCRTMSEAETRIRQSMDEDIDGLLIIPPFADAARILDIVESDAIPAVVVTSSQVRDSVCRVGVDAYRAAREMTEHLVGLGHQRIGLIAGPTRHATSQHRLDGYRDALKAAGLSYDQDCIARGDFSYRSGIEAAGKLIGLPKRPTAIFACNDDMASAAATVAHRAGLDIPADLSICGFDDTPIATAIWPQLTTIHVPVLEITRVAVDLLVQNIRASRNDLPLTARQVTVDYTLVRRQSDAPPVRRAASRSGKR